MQALGRHLLLELWGCNPNINDPEAVRRALIESVEAVGAKLINVNVHAFSPYGVTGLALLAESHMSLHSWPEHGYLAADLFTCGTSARPREAVSVLQGIFEPERIEVQEIRRGVRPMFSQPINSEAPLASEARVGPESLKKKQPIVEQQDLPLTS
ncbi:MAG: adenosylmethionine decarboxylase [Planctomycetaceae bacterium]|nr:adenosylmethionine decarboxylase [Planctomycetaceae bacterium]